MTKRFALLTSTGASVAQTVWRANEGFREALALVITDRDCPGAAWARDSLIPVHTITEVDRNRLSDVILHILVEQDVDYVLVFFTRLLTGELLIRYRDRLVNFHPSLLPVAPGLHGYEDSLETGALFIGCTAHFVDGGTDTGPQIMQSVVSAGPPVRRHERLRHKIFQLQCIQLLQTCHWLQEGRIRRGAMGVEVLDGDYSGHGPHTPAVDTDVAMMPTDLPGFT